MKICSRCSYQNMDQDPVCRNCGFPLQVQPGYYGQAEGNSMNFQGQLYADPHSVQNQPPQPQPESGKGEKPGLSSGKTAEPQTGKKKQKRSRSPKKDRKPLSGRSSAEYAWPVFCLS